MMYDNKSKWIGGALLACVLIFAAFSILFVVMANLSVWVVPATILITVGIGYIAYSSFYKGNEPLQYYFGPKNSSYALGWGVILTFLGIILLSVFVFEGLSVFILIALLLLFIGLIAFIRIMGGRTGGN